MHHKLRRTNIKEEKVMNTLKRKLTAILLTFAMLIFLYHVILPNPELGPQYNHILQQFMHAVGNGTIPAL